MNFNILPNKMFLMLGYKDTNNYRCVLYLYISFLYTPNKTKHWLEFWSPLRSTRASCRGALDLVYVYICVYSHTYNTRTQARRTYTSCDAERDGCMVGGGHATGGGAGPFWIDLLHARPDYGATL